MSESFESKRFENLHAALAADDNPYPAGRKAFYFSDINDICSWDKPNVTSRKISKWYWLWRQFLCMIGLSKRPSMIYGIDLGNGEDSCVEAWGFINDCVNRPESLRSY
jgi:hypothetical protein